MGEAPVIGGLDLSPGPRGPGLRLGTGRGFDQRSVMAVNANSGLALPFKGVRLLKQFNGVDVQGAAGFLISDGVCQFDGTAGLLA